MFTGALAASFYGRARTTRDIDVVVAVVGRDWKSKLVSALKRAGLVVEEEKIDEALRSGYKIATFKNGKSPLMVDIIFSDTKLEKKAGKILGMPTFYQKPEDLVLAKLRMIKATKPRERALKDEEDVRAILKFTRVDLDELKRRARKENTLSIFEALMAE
ncbi:MAG: hypothetical protein QXL57_03190 [Candidatus Bathyarchaeia archaeon]